MGVFWAMELCVTPKPLVLGAFIGDVEGGDGKLGLLSVGFRG